MKPEQILYTAKVISTGGREGLSLSDDNALSVRLSTPKELGGAGGSGTNPEQLFAAGYSACFLGALKYVASKKHIAIPSTAQVGADVGIGPIPTGFALRVKLEIRIPELDLTEIQELVDAAHQVCPYSNATRGNVDVELVVTN